MDFEMASNRALISICTRNLKKKNPDSDARRAPHAIASCILVFYLFPFSHRLSKQCRPWARWLDWLVERWARWHTSCHGAFAQVRERETDRQKPDRETERGREKPRNKKHRTTMGTKRLAIHGHARGSQSWQIEAEGAKREWMIMVKKSQIFSANQTPTLLRPEYFFVLWFRRYPLTHVLMYAILIPSKFFPLCFFVFKRSGQGQVAGTLHSADG